MTQWVRGQACLLGSDVMGEPGNVCAEWAGQPGPPLESRKARLSPRASLRQPPGRPGRFRAAGLSSADSQKQQDVFGPSRASWEPEALSNAVWTNV